MDESGVITAKKPGDTVITVSADGTNVTCRVKVKRPNVILRPGKATMNCEGELQLAVQTNSKTIPKWKSSRPSVAAVDDRGHVIALKEGKSIITVTVDGVTAKATITVQ